MERMRRWQANAHGLDVLRYEWARYKRVVRLSDVEKVPKIRQDHFRQLFYRLRAEAAGPVHELSQSWTTRLGPKLRERRVNVKLQSSCVRNAMKPLQYFSVDRPDGSLCVFQLLRWSSGLEKVVHTGFETDLRDTAYLQFFDVWRRHGDTCLVITPSPQTDFMSPQTLVESFDNFREKLQVWSHAPADTAGCLELSSPLRAIEDVDYNDPECPPLFILERLRALGWLPMNAMIKHTRTSKEPPQPRSCAQSKLSRAKLS